mmetsp:Transcript_27956/g.74238  ORF Transcript_27956/g.74238 Transcript_27956/m.74238 type:complete len:240 (+) Transcript_27956:3244-3963(+)
MPLPDNFSGRSALHCNCRVRGLLDGGLYHCLSARSCHTSWRRLECLWPSLLHRRCACRCRWWWWRRRPGGGWGCGRGRLRRWPRRGLCRGNGGGDRSCRGRCCLGGHFQGAEEATAAATAPAAPRARRSLCLLWGWRLCYCWRGCCHLGFRRDGGCRGWQRWRAWSNFWRWRRLWRCVLRTWRIWLCRSRARRRSSRSRCCSCGCIRCMAWSHSLPGPLPRPGRLQRHSLEWHWSWRWY